MAYTPINWQTGDIITAEKLNEMDNDTSTIPMECISGTTTFADMESAYGSGQIMFFKPFPETNAMYYVTSFTDEIVNFFPEHETLTAGFDDGVFIANTIQ